MKFKGIKEYIRTMKMIKPRRLAYYSGLAGECGAEASVVLVIPIIIKLMIDAAIEGDIRLLRKGVFIASIEAIIISFLFVIFSYLLWSSAHRIIGNIRILMVKHAMKLPLSYFEKNHSGDLISRISNDVGVFWGLFGWFTRQLVFMTLSGVGSAIIMLILDWRFSIILILFGIISSIINVKFSKQIRKLSDKIQKSMGKITEKTSDMFAGFIIMKMFHLQETLMRKFTENSDEIKDLTFLRFKERAKMDTWNFIISWINFAGIITIGAIFSISGSIDLGTVVAEINLLGNVNFFIRNIGGILGDIQYCLAGSSRVFEFLDEKPEPVAYRDEAEDLQDNMLEMRDVFFEYGDNQVLKGLNLTIKNCQIAALVGGSGGGKSTIVKLIMGFYPISKGNIMINNKSMGKYKLEELRSMIAYVPQEAYMFDGNVEENIKFGKMDATADEVIEAAKAAYAHDFIMEMKDGYKTDIGERGIRLSGGQKQRIAIARAILKDAPILLLDVATSSLDSHSEQQVQDALNRLMQGKTVLIVAHRLSTVEHADIIYVVEDGQVIEKGKHSELLNINGSYSRLYNL